MPILEKKSLEKDVLAAAVQINTLIDEIQTVVVGQRLLIRNLIIALLAHGHILLEWVPWLAKTLSIETLAKTIGVAFWRVQFTPDLLPSDLVWSTIYDPNDTEFHVKQWPIFTNLLLADEINRAPAKVQSALLEAMAERQVTIGDQRFILDEPFVVMATQNPLEQEGIYSLPEAQLDRFLLKTVITYPTEEEELDIMKTMGTWKIPSVKKVWKKTDIKKLQKIVEDVFASESIYAYIKNVVFATRYPEKFGCDEVAAYIQFGVSPRASLALLQTAKVLACMEWRTYVLPEDVKAIAHDVMRHRLLLSFDALADGVTQDDIITKILAKVPVVDE